MGWVAAADFHRVANGNGSVHPCRAYGKVEHMGGDLVIGAVATGSAGAALSHLGAKVAVRACLAHLAEAGSLQRALGAGGGAETTQLFAAMGHFVLEQLRAAAFNRVTGVRSLATNLTAFIAGSDGLVAARIGDGIVLIGTGSGYASPFPEARRTVSDTASVAAGQIDEAMQIGAQSGPIGFVCAASAGIPDLTRKGFLGGRRDELLRPLDRFTRTASDDSDVHLALRSFFRSKHVNGKVDQDLGFAICGYHNEQQRTAA